MLFKNKIHFRINEVIIVLLIAIASVIPSIFLFIPENESSIIFFGLVIEAGALEDIQYYFWLISIKVSLIIFLFCWFLSCKNWWKIAILVPLTIELLKLISIFNEDIIYFDEVNYIHSLPITLPLIFILLLIFKSLNKHVYYSNLNNEIEELFNEINSSNDVNTINIEFEKLKSQKHQIEESIYLKQLMNLRDKLYRDL